MMVIHDLPTLRGDEALSLARETVRRHPGLEAIFDDAVLADLVARRGATDNALLLRLVQPGSEVTDDFWVETLTNLRVLGPAATAHFRPKMRQHGPGEIVSWQTELWFAATLRRAGVPLTLEPSVGARRAEFVTETDPPVHWEIKSPADRAELRTEDQVLEEISRRFHRIPEPYWLELRKAPTTPQEVVRAAKGARAQLADAHARHLMPPFQVGDDALVLEATSMSKPGHGGLGARMTEHVFENENSARLVGIIRAAAGQVPRNQSNVIVLDYTNASWIAEHDVVDACFGPEGMTFTRTGKPLNVHSGERVFRSGYHTRVSAVVAYTRRYTGRARLVVLPNPYAAKPLGPEAFAAFRARFARVAEVRPGYYVVEHPEHEDTDLV
jgi:hypothetical protein